MVKLMCKETVHMQEDGRVAFTAGKEYRGRQRNVQGLNGDPWSYTRVVSVKNDFGESHFVQHINDDSLNEFYEKHFDVIK